MITSIPRIGLLIVLWVLALPAGGLATPPDLDLPVMHKLNLHQVRLMVVSAPEVNNRFQDRVRNLFENAGLLLPPADRFLSPPSALLKLTLNPTLIGDTCPGQVLHTPSIALIEPVIVPRNGELMQDITWSAETSPQIRAPLTVEELEHDIDWLVSRFIETYHHANPPPRSQETGHERKGSANPDSDHGATSPTASEIPDAPAGVSLRGLAIDRLQLLVLAGRLTSPLTTRALHQLRTAGLPVALEPRGHDTPSLSLELIQRAIDDHCSGRVLYEAGLFLVEPVRLTRNPQIRIWSDTWVRERVQIVPPVPLQQVESDQDALLTEFIHSFQAR